MGDEEHRGDDARSESPQTGPGGASAGGPERIGPYRILSLLGEGGFGRVYLAEQAEPVRRRVALKVIKPGMDSRAVILRFEAERQALAMMDHPNVARVLDAGTTEGGLPYFVMEHVAGVPITDYCARAGLGVRAKLELFMKVCDAVQHAHQKGVMHRDLKPSNVLVEYEDGRAVPKVIDFGVAKALAQPLTDQAVHTAAGQFIGTPEYMSPEQADGSALDVDTRSDVYSLGVMLYELLTGRLPFDGEKLRYSGQLEMVRMIREEQPKRPSTRVGERGDAKLPTPDGRALASRLRGDLDWIVMKCIEKDRTRRYSTPNGLARDIQRHLQHEPVVAGPPGAAYRIRKFVQRNRAGVIAASAVVLALILGFAAMTIGFVRAEEARRAEARQRAEVEKAFAFMTDEFIEAVAPEQMGPDVTMREVLDAAAPKIGDHFAGSPVAEAEVRFTFGRTYLDLGLYRPALEQFRLAHDLRVSALGPEHPDVFQALDGEANALLRLGRLDDADPIIKAAVEGRSRVLGPLHEDTLITMTKATALHFLRWRQAADRSGPEAQGELAQAAEISRRVYEAREQVSGPTHTETLIALQNYAALLQAQQRPEEADALLVEALEATREAHGDRAGITLQLVHRLGGLCLGRGQLDRAIPLLEEALAGRRAVFLDDHPDTITTLLVLGDAYEADGRLETCVDLMTEVLESATQRGSLRDATLASMRILAGRLETLGRADEAERWRARAAAGELAARESSVR